MEVAGVVIGSIALTLALFSSAYAAFQLQHVIHFRKPVFTVEEVELPVKERAGYTFFVGPGHFVVNVRGATHLVTLTKQMIHFFRGGRPRGGFGTEMTMSIPPLVWTRVAVPFQIGMGMEELPPSLDVEIYLSNPRDLYVVPIQVELSQDSSKYVYHDWGYTRLIHRMVWRHHGRLRRFLRTVSRGRLG